MSNDARTILLVEDEFLIALDLQAQIEAAGYRVVGPAATVEEGMALLDAGPVHMAVLDMNLRGSTSFPIAERLEQAGTPFMFLSGNDALRLQGEFSGRTVLTKPINYAILLKHIKDYCCA
jgi:DNA-binding response OmpR family regulator